MLGSCEHLVQSSDEVYEGGVIGSRTCNMTIAVHSPSYCTDAVQSFVLLLCLMYISLLAGVTLMILT